MAFQYLDTHSILERESLDRGNQLRVELLELGLPPEEFDKVFNQKLDFIYARLPVEFWEGDVPPRVPRALVRELQVYLSNCMKVKRYGLGLSLISPRFDSKTSALYYLCRELIVKGYSCFTSSFRQFIFLLRESRDDATLKEEITERLRANFFFLLDVPEADDLPAYLKPDLLARLELRLLGGQAILFSAETGVSSLNELSSNSLLSDVLIPFARVNKLVSVTDNTDLDLLYKDRWELVNGTN